MWRKRAAQQNNSRASELSKQRFDNMAIVRYIDAEQP